MSRNREYSERQFVQALFFAFTEQDAPEKETECLTEEIGWVLAALREAASRLNIDQLQRLAAAADGLTQAGSSLVPSCPRCGKLPIDPVSIGSAYFCMECTCRECGVELSEWESDSCELCMRHKEANATDCEAN